MTRPGLALLLLPPLLCAGCADRPVARIVEVQGRLHDRAGAPLRGTIRASGASEAAADSDGDGRFVLRIPDGAYVVTATAPRTLEGAVSRAVTIRNAPAAEAIDLVLTGLGSVAGTVLLDDAADHAGTQVVIAASAAVGLTGAGGQFAVDAVPEGRHVLYATHAGYAPSRVGEVEVHSGQTALAAARALVRLAVPVRALTVGRALLPGHTSHDGIRVSVAGTTVAATTAADGSYSLADVPLGIVAVDFAKDGFRAQLARVFVPHSGDPIVLAPIAYPLGDVSLVQGERLGTPRSPSVITGKNQRYLAWVEPNGSSPAGEATLVAYEIASGRRFRLPLASHPVFRGDGDAILVVRAASSTAITTDLQLWDPATGAVRTIEPAVSDFVYLDRIDRVLALAPLRAVDLAGGGRVDVGSRSGSYGIAPDQRSVVVPALSDEKPMLTRWISLDTGALIDAFNSPSYWFASGGRVLLHPRDHDLVAFDRGSGQVTTIDNNVFDVRVPTADSRYIVYQARGYVVYDLMAHAAAYRYSGETVSAMAPDGVTFVVAECASGGGACTLTKVDLATGSASGTLTLPIVPALSFLGRDELVLSGAFSPAGGTLYRCPLASFQCSALVDNLTGAPRVVGDLAYFSVRNGAAVENRRLRAGGIIESSALVGGIAELSPDGARVLGLRDGVWLVGDWLTGATTPLHARVAFDSGPRNAIWLGSGRFLFVHDVTDQQLTTTPALEASAGIFLTRTLTPEGH
jgi:hypothetical protein